GGLDGLEHGIVGIGAIIEDGDLVSCGEWRTCHSLLDPQVRGEEVFSPGGGAQPFDEFLAFPVIQPGPLGRGDLRPGIVLYIMYIGKRCAMAEGTCKNQNAK